MANWWSFEGLFMNAIEMHTQANSPSADTSAISESDDAYRAKAGAAAEKFEGFFISQMLRQMRASTREIAGEDSMFKDSANADMLDLSDTVLADKMASLRAFGIADAILRQLLPAKLAVAAPDHTGQVSQATEGQQSNGQ
jgi:flagellar protein FlgJ